MLKLATSVEQLFGVGEQRAKLLKKLGLKTVRDLLFYFPFRFEDWTKISSIAQILESRKPAIIQAKIKSVDSSHSPRQRMALLKAVLEDDSGEIAAVWFNRPYLAQILREGTEWYFRGKVGLYKNQEILSSPDFGKEGRILPFYHETAGVSSGYLRKIIRIGLNARAELKEFLPDWLREKYRLMDWATAIYQIHQPSSLKLIKQAKKRLSFNELLFLALALLSRRSQLNKRTAPACRIDNQLLKNFVQDLEFKLTSAQKKASWQIILDLAKERPMNRLLEGDVGSGKTIVGLMAALLVADNGYQTVWLAPTEILAQQHFSSGQKFLGARIKIALLTSSTSNKPQLKRLIRDGQIDLIIGTHALLAQDVEIPRAGLVIVDEQHRFGVNQRAHILRSHKKSVHFLSMTATPIPRTLALALYGDLDISILDEKPGGRKPVITQVIEEAGRQKTYDFIKKQISQGRQAFVICPLIEESQGFGQAKLFELDKKTVIKEHQKLSQEIFPELKIGMLHGKMKSKEKEKTMADFKAGLTDILVSTAVIEVGIDVANASIMMIEGAEHFGLAQLHQFRGRVGRDQHQSYCFLFANPVLGQSGSRTSRRLQAMEQESDGFRLAELDLELRGPGELAGIRQSGLPDLKIASLADTILVKQAREAAEEILSQGLKNFPDLKQELKRFDYARHLE